MIPANGGPRYAARRASLEVTVVDWRRALAASSGCRRKTVKRRAVAEERSSGLCFLRIEVNSLRRVRTLETGFQVRAVAVADVERPEGEAMATRREAGKSIVAVAVWVSCRGSGEERKQSNGKGREDAEDR